MLKLTVMMTLVCFISYAEAQEAIEQKEVQSEGQLVEVEIAEDVTGTYKQQRGTHGAYFSIDYEDLNLTNYITTVDAQQFYGDVFDTPIPLLKIAADYKFNFSIASLAFGVEYGKGSLSDDKTGQDRTIDISKYGLGIKLALDMITDEPYVVPYLGFNAWKMDISETAPTDSFEGTTEIGFNYTAGVLIQLDWIDTETSQTSQFGWGLKNTFLDLYATKYAQTMDEMDANTETDILYGGGIRLEF